MQKWTSRIETPIKAELICYDVNGIHIVFGVTEENQLKLFHFSHAPFDAENPARILRDSLHPTDISHFY